MSRALPVRHAGSPLRTNAQINRESALKCFQAGMCAADIAAEWPEVWRLVSERGRRVLSQRYDYELGDGSGRYETERLITRASVAAAIRRHRAQERGSR